MEFDQVQGEFDIIWNRHAIFKIAAIFQHHSHMPCMCICIGICICICICVCVCIFYMYMYRYISVYPQNRRGILVKMVHEHGLHYFLCHITESIWILEDVVASSYI